MSLPSVISLADLELADLDAPAVDLVGTKGSLLATLGTHGFNVPGGFVATTALYLDTVRMSRVERQLRDIWDAASHARPEHIPGLARRAHYLISELRLDPAVVRDIIQLTGTFGDDIAVAVRASLPSDAVSGPECAGVHASVINVVGIDQILVAIRRCWASLFGERALAMRSRALGPAQPSMAVLVQPMIAAVKSGIAAPIDRGSRVLIEATFGLGAPITDGAVEPDRYVVDVETLAICSKTIGHKHVVLPADPTAGFSFAEADRVFAQVLDPAELAAVTALCTDVAHVLGGPHELEWAIDPTDVAVVQVRPIAQLDEASSEERDEGSHGQEGDGPSDSEHSVVTGLGIGLGTAAGQVRVIHHDDNLATVRSGDVVVATTTMPHWTPHLLRAAAIVTDEGDEYAHPAHFAREYGIPAVVSTTTATAELADGQMVSVDAHRGIVATPGDD